MSPDSAASEPTAGWAPLGPARRGALLALWRDHYAVAPEVFDDLVFWERADSGSLWAFRREHPLPLRPSPETAGLRVRRGHKPDTQLANGFLRRFFAGATRHVARLHTPELVRAWVEATPLPANSPPTGPRRGWLSDGGDGYWVAVSPLGVLGRARLHRGVFVGEPSRGERGPLEV